MKQIVKDMIKLYKIDKLGFDFCGYSLQKGDIYTYHHNIIARRNGGPETISNGAILCGKASHQYLHLIEAKDFDMFSAITSEMIDENVKGYLDMENLRHILDVLHCFEREHCSDRGKKGNYLIKDEYLYRPALEEPMKRVRRK